MYELALFAGVGGGMLGGKLLGWKTIGAVEFNSYCREVIFRRQRDGMFPLFPIWDDVRTFRKDNPETRAYCEALSEMADELIITAGFPCQPFSAAGKRKKEKDDRNMWPDTIRIIREVGPRIAFLENVPGLLSCDYYGEILGDLAEAGYDAEWTVVSAAECGAPHKRKRLWIIAYKSADADRNGQFFFKQMDGREKNSSWKTGNAMSRSGIVDKMADSESYGRRDRRTVEEQRCDAKVKLFDKSSVDGEIREKGYIQNEKGIRTNIGWWSKDPANVAGTDGISIERRWGIKPGLGRVADGVADRMDRLKAIGNGQVSIVAAVAFYHLAMSVGLNLEMFAPALFNND